DGERLQQPRQDERQRLERLDWPFEIERRFESLRGEGRNQRTDVLAARQRLPAAIAASWPCVAAELAPPEPTGRASSAPTHGRVPRMPIAIGASASASSPRATTVSPARACARMAAAVHVDATAT